MTISPAMQRLISQTRPVSPEETVISVKEIESILYLGVFRGVDNPREVENHTVDTYA